MKKIIFFVVSAFVLNIAGCTNLLNSDTEYLEQTENMDKKEEAKDAQTEKNLILDGKIIVIDPGHGLNYDSSYEPEAPESFITKPAYVSGTRGKYQTEEELNLSVGKILYDRLTGLNAKVYMTRHGHYSQRSNIERAEFANELNADICIRLHADGSENKEISGISMLIPAENHFEDIDILKESKKAGEILFDNIIRSTGAKKIGITPRADLAGFNWSKVPVVLIEMGFMSNENDDYMLSQKDYQEKIADGIINGLEEYFQE